MLMRKGIIAACLAAAATVLSPVAGECAEGFDCVQYIYGTWGVRHSDDIISFDYEVKSFILNQVRHRDRNLRTLGSPIQVSKMPMSMTRLIADSLTCLRP